MSFLSRVLPPRASIPPSWVDEALTRSKPLLVIEEEGEEDDEEEEDDDEDEDEAKQEKDNREKSSSPETHRNIPRAYRDFIRWLLFSLLIVACIVVVVALPWKKDEQISSISTSVSGPAKATSSSGLGLATDCK